MSGDSLQLHFSSENSNFRTPPEVLEPIRLFRPIHFDPFGNPDSLVAAERTICPPDDSLVIPWPRGGLFFANPPYGGALLDCARKIAAEAEAGCEGITLVPARTDTQWFKALAPLRWCAWEGRLTFLETWEEWIARRERAYARTGREEILSAREPCIGDLVADDPAPFPVALCYHGPDPDGFTAHFSRYGTIYAPADAPARAPRRGIRGRRPAPALSLDVVRGFREQGLSVREIMRVLGVPKNRIETALRRLRALDALDAPGGAVAGGVAGVPPGFVPAALPPPGVLLL